MWLDGARGDNEGRCLAVAWVLLHMEAQAAALILEDKKEEQQALLGWDCHPGGGLDQGACLGQEDLTLCFIV